MINPPRQKRANDSTTEIGITLLNTAKMDLNLTEKEIDYFQRKLENFPYHKICFRRKAVVRYSKNLQRILQSNNWTKFNIAIIQKLLDEHEDKKPYLLGKRIGRYLGY